MKINKISFFFFLFYTVFFIKCSYTTNDSNNPTNSAVNSDSIKIHKKGTDILILKTIKEIDKNFLPTIVNQYFTKNENINIELIDNSTILFFDEKTKLMSKQKFMFLKQTRIIQ